MSYATGVATSQEDLIGALCTFATGEGWTVDIYSTGNDWAALNNGTVYVQFRWDNSTAIAMFQSLGFTGTGTAPGNQTGDSGAGLVDGSAPYNSAITSGRRVSVGNGPYTAYHFFTDGTTKYIHIVLEYAAGQYRHFGFGTIDSVGTPSWTGGEYAVAHRWSSGTTSDDPTATGTTGHVVPWDGTGSGGNSTDANECGTIHIESLTGQPAGSKWAIFSSQTTSIGNDRGGNARFNVRGGIRGGSPMLSAMGWMTANLLNGYIPLVPIPVGWLNTTPSPDAYELLGFVPDVAHIQMGNIDPAQEFSVGGDTWKVFPLVRKKHDLDNTEESWNCGIAYKKIV